MKHKRHDGASITALQGENEEKRAVAVDCRGGQTQVGNNVKDERRKLATGTENRESLFDYNYYASNFCDTDTFATSKSDQKLFSPLTRISILFSFQNGRIEPDCQLEHDRV